MGVGRRDTLDEKLGLGLLRAVEIQGKASVFLEYVLQVREHLEGDRQLGLDVTVVGVSHSACVLVVLGESAGPQMMNRQAEHDHLERISLLATSLAPRVEDVPEVVEVSQVGFGGAHGPEILKHVAQLSTNSLNIVTHFKPELVVTGGLASQDVKG